MKRSVLVLARPGTVADRLIEALRELSFQAELEHSPAASAATAGRLKPAYIVIDSTLPEHELDAAFEHLAGTGAALVLLSLGAGVDEREAVTGSAYGAFLDSMRALPA